MSQQYFQGPNDASGKNEREVAKVNKISQLLFW